MSAQEETAKAIAYAEKFDLQSIFEDALTNLLVSHPSDPMGFLYDQIVSKASHPVIDKVIGREVLGSRGIPVIEVEVWGKVYGKSEYLATAAAPSCDYTTTEEAFVLVDQSNPRYLGRGVRQAVSVVTSAFQPILENKQFFNQREMDGVLQSADNTGNRRKVGTNTMIATSAAIALASAKVLRIPLYMHLAKQLTKRTQFMLPRPIFAMFNVKSGPISKVYMLPSNNVPIDDQIRIMGEIYLHYSTSMKSPVCSDGCFPIESDKLDDILQAAEIAASGGGHTLGDDVFLGFCGSKDATVQFWTDLFESSSAIAYVEDPLPFDDVAGLKQVNNKSGDGTVVALGRGISSRPERIQPALHCKAVVVRPPQLGNLTKAVDVSNNIDAASKLSIYATSLNETPDSWIVDVAVAAGAAMIQLGPTAKGENVAKINRLLEIAREIEVRQETDLDD